MSFWLPVVDPYEPPIRVMGTGFNIPCFVLGYPSWRWNDCVGN